MCIWFCRLISLIRCDCGFLRFFRHRLYKNSIKKEIVPLYWICYASVYEMYIAAKIYGKSMLDCGWSVTLIASDCSLSNQTDFSIHMIEVYWSVYNQSNWIVFLTESRNAIHWLDERIIGVKLIRKCDLK